MNIAVAKIGHNRSPFELSKERIEELYEEAKHWLDGEPIETQEQANEVQKLLRMIQEAETEADARRKEEAKPHDEAKAAIQERYNTLIGKTKTVTGLTVKAVKACKDALAPFLMKIEEENERRAAALRKEAEERQREAMEAMQKRNGDLAAAERAEELVRAAKAAEADARRAGNAKAAAKGEGRAVTLRDYYRPEITDYTAFARHVWMTHREDMEIFLDGMSAKLVAAGVHHGIPGVTVHHERKAV